MITALLGYEQYNGLLHPCPSQRQNGISDLMLIQGRTKAGQCRCISQEDQEWDCLGSSSTKQMKNCAWLLYLLVKKCEWL